MSGAGGPIVTIGISTYNRVGGTFPEALRSALAQTYPNLEVLVCDNASVDGTDAFMATQDDPRLRYHRHTTNIGANANFNACLEMARGTYFLLLHDDDRLDPSFVSRSMEVLAGRETGVLLGAPHVIDTHGNILSSVRAPPQDLDAAGLFMAWFDKATSFYLCSTIFHTERLRQLGGFDSPHGLFQDVLAIARLAIRFGYVAVEGVGGAFRRHDQNRGAASDAVHWMEDSTYLLDTICSELPDRRDALHAAGAPYLSVKCYRYVEHVLPLSRRWRLYAEIYRTFDRTYSPWRYIAKRRRSDARRLVGRVARVAGVSYRRDAEGTSR